MPGPVSIVGLASAYPPDIGAEPSRRHGRRHGHHMRLIGAEPSHSRRVIGWDFIGPTDIVKWIHETIQNVDERGRGGSDNPPHTRPGA